MNEYNLADLHFAIISKNTEYAKLIISELSKDKVDLNGEETTAGTGGTSVHLAAQSNQR